MLALLSLISLPCRLPAADFVCEQVPAACRHCRRCLACWPCCRSSRCAPRRPPTLSWARSCCKRVSAVEIKGGYEVQLCGGVQFVALVLGWRQLGSFKPVLPGQPASAPHHADMLSQLPRLPCAPPRREQCSHNHGDAAGRAGEPGARERRSFGRDQGAAPGEPGPGHGARFST